MYSLLPCHITCLDQVKLIRKKEIDAIICVILRNLCGISADVMNNTGAIEYDYEVFKDVF